LLFSTYLGGSKLDFVMAVALDSAGNPIISGTTASDDFPTTPGAYQRQRRGNYDAFVTKLDRDGERIIWSTYYGGSTEGPGPYDNGSMAVDEHGRVWIDGMTAATDLPTRNAFQSSYGGGYLDGFLAALLRHLCRGGRPRSSGRYRCRKRQSVRLGHFRLEESPAEELARAIGIRRRAVRRNCDRVDHAVGSGVPVVPPVWCSLAAHAPQIVHRFSETNLRRSVGPLGRTTRVADMWQVNG
jgi:hypothetical protein